MKHELLNGLFSDSRCVFCSISVLNSSEYMKCLFCNTNHIRVVYTLDNNNFQFIYTVLRLIAFVLSRTES